MQEISLNDAYIMYSIIICDHSVELNDFHNFGKVCMCIHVLKI